MRFTGLTQKIEMLQEPFNNIQFWLGEANQLRRVSQTLTVTLKDRNGTLSEFKYKFNADGLLVR
jgi:hypothetical protein